MHDRLVSAIVVIKTDIIDLCHRLCIPEMNCWNNNIIESTITTRIIDYVNHADQIQILFDQNCDPISAADDAKWTFGKHDREINLKENLDKKKKKITNLLIYTLTITRTQFLVIFRLLMFMCLLSFSDCRI